MQDLEDLLEKNKEWQFEKMMVRLCYYIISAHSHFIYHGLSVIYS